MYFVYILKSPNDHIYVGCTKNISQRIKRHVKGIGAEFTYRNKAFDLVYKETYKTLKEAKKREKQIKGWRREKKENLIKYRVPFVRE